MRIALVLVIAAALVATAVWQVGPEPRSADDGFPDAPPPLALPSDTPDRSALATAAAQLANGDLDAARAGFVDVVAEDQGSVAGQVGLVLSRWRSTGPRSVERDLRQLTLEYPDSALAALHLGLVQSLLGDDRAARATLGSAVELGRMAREATSLRMARIADDLLHPDTFRGALPVLVSTDEIAAGDRSDLRQLRVAVTADDRIHATRIAARLEGSRDVMARVAAITATFDKGDPDAVVERLRAVATSTAAPAAASDRAEFISTLAELWGGGDRDAGCARLLKSTDAATDAATRRYAVPIRTELCDESAPPVSPGA